MPNWKSAGNAPLGQSTPGGVEITPTARIGQTAKFFDDTLGEGTFIYLPGVANTLAGDLVQFDATPGAPVTIRNTSANGANSGRPVAVACVAAGAGTYSWYQIGGAAIVNAIAGAAPGPMFSSATPGAVGSAAVAGAQILSARIETPLGTPAAGQVYAVLNSPLLQGQIT
jgi:hypothetical protein